MEITALYRRQFLLLCSLYFKILKQKKKGGGRAKIVWNKYMGKKKFNITQHMANMPLDKCILFFFTICSFVINSRYKAKKFWKWGLTHSSKILRWIVFWEVYPTLFSKIMTASTLNQGCTNFPKIWQKPQNIRHKKDNANPIKSRGPTNIRRHHVKCSLPGGLVSGFCAPSLYLHSPDHLRGQPSLTLNGF